MVRYMDGCYTFNLLDRKFHDNSMFIMKLDIIAIVVVGVAVGTAAFVFFTHRRRRHRQCNAFVYFAHKSMMEIKHK